MFLWTGITSVVRKLVRLAFRTGRSRQTPVLGHGVLCGCFALTCVQQAISCFGTTPPVSIAMFVAIAIGWSIAMLRPFSAEVASVLPNTSARQSGAALVVGLALWSIVHPMLLDAAAWIITASRWPLDSNWSAAMLVGVTFLVSLSPPAWAMTRLAICLAGESRSASRSQLHRVEWADFVPASFLIGLGCGMASSGLWVAPRIGLELTSLVAAAAAGAWATLRVLRPTPSPTADGVNVIELSTCESVTERDCPPTSWREPIVVAFGCVASGGLLAVWLRMADQIVPQTSLTLAGELGTLAIGVALGIRFTGAVVPRRSWNVELVRTRFVAGLAMWSCVVVAMFPLLAASALWLNAFVSNPTLLLLGRLCLTASLLVPAAFVLAMTATSDRQPTQRGIVINVLLALLGHGITEFELIPGGSLVVLSMAFAGGLLIVVAASWRRIDIASVSWFCRVGWTLPFLLLPSSLLWMDWYSPAATARTLFSTNVSVARRGKLASNLLQHLDDGRLLQIREGSRGTYTVWKHNGHQIHWRENGVPIGVASLDSEIFPTYAAEVLPAALPLILHEAPQRVMVLGLGSGEPLRAALEFPIQSLVCVEPDRALVRLVEEVPFDNLGRRIPVLEAVDGENAPLIQVEPPPTPTFLFSFLDDRLRFEVVDPALAMLGTQSTDRFDVIVSNPDHSFLARSAPYFTRQFYANAARRLAAGGVFSQRLQMLDYGPEPLRRIVATLQSVFRDVAAMEMAPGEFVLLATNDERGLIRPPLTSRLAAPHLRSLLARVGIDWSALLGFGGYSHDTLAEFSGGGRRINTVADSRLAFSLPCEVLRWGTKVTELQASLVGQGSTLAMWIGDAEDLTEGIRRQRDVSEQIDLLATTSDEYWAYRRRVKELITKRPESAIRQVKHDRGGSTPLPDTAWRLKYFEALGRAAKTKSTADIDRVAEFESPYDPLVSYFLHQEVAELLSRADERDCARELRHRWHALYFTSANDRSVRNVCDVINLLLDHPEAEPKAIQRRDDLDALLQLLATRWQLRIGSQPKSTQAMLQDVDLTLKVTDRACDALAELTRECGLPTTAWSARRSVVQQLITLPLRDYRARLLPIHQQNVARLQALQSSD
jgi:hypothetical protein